MTGLAATRAAVWTGDDDVIAGFEDRIHLRLDIGAIADNSLDDGSSADLVLDRLDGSARGGRDPVGPRLEFAIMEILGLRRRATGEFSLELCGFLFQVDPHQLRSDERHEEQCEDISQHIGDGVAGGYVGLLLAQYVLGKSQLCQRARCGADHRGLR